jgi:hypothetical protein
VDSIDFECFFSLHHFYAWLIIGYFSFSALLKFIFQTILLANFRRNLLFNLARKWRKSEQKLLENYEKCCQRLLQKKVDETRQENHNIMVKNLLSYDQNKTNYSEQAKQLLGTKKIMSQGYLDDETDSLSEHVKDAIGEIEKVNEEYDDNHENRPTTFKKIAV